MEDKQQGVTGASVDLHENALNATAQDNLREHSTSLGSVMLRHKKIVWWTFFFAMSAVAWYIPRPSREFQQLT